MFDPATGALLHVSLFRETTCRWADNAIGQFFPHAAGGANSTSGFDAKSLVMEARAEPRKILTVGPLLSRELI